MTQNRYIENNHSILQFWITVACYTSFNPTLELKLNNSSCIKISADLKIKICENNNNVEQFKS